MIDFEKPTMLKTIAMDPPWCERGGGKSKRGADGHYPVMKKKDILKAVLESGAWNPDPAGCSVWTWATVNHLPDALWLMQNLGVTYVTNAVWVKAEKKIVTFSDQSMGGVVIPQAPGLGQRLRVCHELLLWGRIGKVPIPLPRNRMPSVIYAPRGKHSVKPQEAYDLIARHDGHHDEDGEPRAELFARNPRKGWMVHGDEL